MDQRTRGIGPGNRGRIILLGDGTEMLTDGDDQEIDEEEDKDLESQVSRTTSSSDDGSNIRSQREGTPAPEEKGVNPFDTPSSTSTEKSAITEEPKSTLKPAADEQPKDKTEKGSD